MNIRHQTNHPDLASYWMPFTANRQFKAAPRLLISAQGMHYTGDDGRKVLDGTAGLWCVNAGHGRAEIAQAVERQLSTLDYAPSFQLGHPIAFDFATRLARVAPGGVVRRGRVGQRNIERRTDPPLRMNMVGVKPLAAQADRPGSCDANGVAPMDQRRMLVGRRGQLRDMPPHRLEDERAQRTDRGFVADQQMAVGLGPAPNRLVERRIARSTVNSSCAGRPRTMA